MFQSQPQAINENEFYEHLTELIRVYKRIIFAVEDVYLMIKTDADYQSNIAQIRNIMLEEEQLTLKYDFSLQNHRNYHSAYHRFICRLIENIATTKMKVINEESKIILVQQLLTKLQNCINFHRKEKNLAQMFKRIFVYVFKFCQGCEMLLSCYSQNQAVDALRKQVEQQKSEGEKVIAKAVPCQSQSNFQKIMSVFNKRFVTISCLDLDYSQYKTYCFMSRNDPDDELYKDIQTRNCFTAKAIARYSRHFSQFLKRKEKNIIRKNRLRELKNNIKTNEPLIDDQQRQHTNSTTLQINNELNKTEEPCIVSLPILKEQQKKSLLESEQKKEANRRLEGQQVRRGHYEMKSIYLTINKCNDRLQNANRFMFNYSITKQQEAHKKYSTVRINQTPVKSTKAINQSVMMERQRVELCQSPPIISRPIIAISPRVSIIHKASDSKRGDKRNIRITNLTFRNHHHTRLNSLLDPESLVLY